MTFVIELGMDDRNFTAHCKDLRGSPFYSTSLARLLADTLEMTALEITRRTMRSELVLGVTGLTIRIDIQCMPSVFKDLRKAEG